MPVNIGRHIHILSETKFMRYSLRNKTSFIRLFLMIMFTSIVDSSFGAAETKDTVRLLTNWYAQAEHGGLYQAEELGLYDKAGLSVEIKQGGPQINGMQMLLGGEADVILGFDIQVLKAQEQHIPVIAIAASFQSDLVGMMAHDDVHSLADLKDKTVLVATAGRSTWWPWLKRKYGLSDEQVRPYTFNLQPFFADNSVVQQAYPSAEPFQAKKNGVPVHFLALKDEGYPPYGLVFVTTRAFLEQKPDVLKRFLAASFEGWKEYLANPKLGNAAIKVANPNMDEDQLNFGHDILVAMGVVDGGDAKSDGIGTMKDSRFKATFDFLVSEGLIDKNIDYKSALTEALIKDIHVK
jgi:NitT/TauT family transport system substrate-binding protein